MFCIIMFLNSFNVCAKLFATACFATELMKWVNGFPKAPYVSMANVEKVAFFLVRTFVAKTRGLVSYPGAGVNHDAR